MPNRPVIALCLLLAFALSSRASDQIRSYTVPKESSVASPGQPQPAKGAADIPVNSAPVQWTLPEGWQQLPPDGVRLGNFAVPGKNGGAATVAITSFPGDVGGELANVNRWRQQLDLPQIGQSNVASTPVTVDSADGKLYDLAGSAARTIVALIQRNGATWFFKMTGDIGAVDDNRPAFMDFLKSIRFTSGGDAASATTTAATSAAPAPAPVSEGNSSPKWTIPSNWSEKAPGPMQFKSFTIADNAGANAAVTVSFFPGAVGGVLANVNRWRGQMGLAAVAEDQLDNTASKLETAGGTATLVDFEGTDAQAGQRIVAVIAPHGDNTWFYKLMGDKALVGTEKDSFVNFVKTVQYP